VGDPTYTTWSNNEGRADWEWVAPADAVPGTWTMIAQQFEEDDDDERELVEGRYQRISFEIVPIEQVEALPPAEVDAPNSQTRNVTPAVNTPGSLFTFFATGFKPNENVSYWFTGPDGSSYPPEGREFVVNVNDRGRADWEGAPPLDAVPGIWRSVALGHESGVQRVIFFELVPFDAAPAPAGGASDRGADPAVSAPHDTIAFFATGFARKETVSFWAESPGGRTYRGNEVKANDDGRADWFWRSPSDAEPGTWEMVAYGNESEVVKIITFEIRR
jgi:hypothetical protein